MAIFPSGVGSEYGRIYFRNAAAFWLGCAAIVVGVLLHIPMYASARHMHYKLAGMAVDPPMIVGMVLIVLGLMVAAYGITPRAGERAAAESYDHAYSIRALDDARFGSAHAVLVVVMAVALIVDIMKPASLAFTLPGMGTEYGLSKATVAWLPFVALFGTSVGSFLWGWMGDWIGRRATVLLASMLFVGTSICAAMPGFGWNLLMCFLMGLAAGGLLPVAIALLSELLPVRHRAAAIVLLGGIGAVGGYLVASTSSTLWVPTYSWRIMWFLNLPTGVLLLLLNRYIPESPRFLLSQHRVREAEHILQHFGAGIVQQAREKVTPRPAVARRIGLTALFQPPYLGQTVAVALFGLSWGLVNYGFFLWLPSNLLAGGFSVQSASALLAKSALYAFPGVLIVAWLYSRWSSRRTIVLVSFLTAVALLAFLPLATTAHQHTAILTLLVLALIITASAMTSTLSPYSAEIYPTEARATGAGIAAGAGKIGGVLGVGAVLAKVTPTLQTSALLVAIPVAVAMISLGILAIETRGRRLEDTSALIDPREFASEAGGTV